MRFGYLSHNHLGGIGPAALARELEDRGFESIWVPEHSHIPVDSGPYPGGGMPDSTWKSMDPFVSLATAGAASTTLLLGTGVCLPLEHDLLDLACTIASLDALVGSRLLLGVGAGWNEAELADHRPDVPFTERFAALRERIAALRTAWTEDRPAFEGRWDRFPPARIEPRPPRGTVPVLVGAAGPLGRAHAVAYGDGWCPVDVALRGPDGRPDVAAGLAAFRARLEAGGRDPADVPVTLFHWRRPGTERHIAEAVELGVARVVFMPPEAEVHGAARTRADLDELAPWLARWADASAG